MRKCQEGTALDDWLKAEREILARYMSGMIDRERLLAIKDGAITAIQRSRYVFLLINVSAIIIFAAEFNAMLPWIRHFKDNNADLLRELGVIAIPFIGVKTSVFDLQINAALAMLILAIWFWFALRRENHAIGLVVKPESISGWRATDLNICITRSWNNLCLRRRALANLVSVRNQSARPLRVAFFKSIKS
jgi:hypothetical protein